LKRASGPSSCNWVRCAETARFFVDFRVGCSQGYPTSTCSRQCRSGVNLYRDLMFLQLTSPTARRVQEMLTSPVKKRSGDTAQTRREDNCPATFDEQADLAVPLVWVPFHSISPFVELVLVLDSFTCLAEGACQFWVWI
jgi:hypothetical protein